MSVALWHGLVLRCGTVVTALMGDEVCGDGATV